MKVITLFQHDCQHCTYLGPFYGGKEEAAYDLYWCEQGGGLPTVIARFSDDGPDYMSGCGSSLGALVEAEKRSVIIGLRLAPESV